MKKIDYFTIEDTIETIDGMLKITDWSFGTFFCEEYEISEDGNLEPKGIGRYLASEIASLMKEVDGKNHIVIFNGWEDDND